MSKRYSGWKHFVLNESPTKDVLGNKERNKKRTTANKGVERNEQVIVESAYAHVEDLKNTVRLRGRKRREEPYRYGAREMKNLLVNLTVAFEQGTLWRASSIAKRLECGFTATELADINACAQIQNHTVE